MAKNQEEGGRCSGILLLLLLLVAMFFTNPKASDHRKAVNNSINKILNQKIEIYETLNKILNNDYVKNLIEATINSNVKRNNYFIISFTEFNTGDDYQIIGIGILGKVYIFDAFEEELENILNNLEKVNPFST
jgi:hypothetical protein